MNATNRVMNRVLLFVAGAVVLGGGVVALAAGVLGLGDSPAWLRRPLGAVADAAATVSASTWQIAGLGTVPVLLVVATAAAVLLAVVLLVFLATRGRGGTKTVIELDAPDGRTAVDRTVLDALLTDPLIRRPDVLSARTSAYRIGRTRAVELAVTVRPGAPLGAVLAAAEAAVRAGDALLGARIPIMLHLSDRRWRDAFRAPTRVR
ncbi:MULTISPECIES: hypothetical protein [unclassified Microbacterium]|uniref:hypothetical protein n=1 Tax=unclassified Microbacterium TaxID=2609290 RepID=UPI00301ABB91